MTISAYKGRCPACGHNHDASSPRLADMTLAAGDVAAAKDAQINKLRSKWGDALEKIQQLKKRNNDLTLALSPESKALISELEILRQSCERQAEKIKELERSNSASLAPQI